MIKNPEFCRELFHTIAFVYTNCNLRIKTEVYDEEISSEVYECKKAFTSKSISESFLTPDCLLLATLNPSFPNVDRE